MVGMVKDKNGYSIVHALKLVSLSGENRTIEAHYNGTWIYLRPSVLWGTGRGDISISADDYGV